MLNPKNMSLAVGILSLSCLGAKKHAIKECQPPSWILPLPVWSHSHVMSPNGKLDPENRGIAVGVSLISCLEAKIHAFVFGGRHLGLSTSGLVAQSLI